MYICLCKGVSDRRICRAVGEGVLSLRELSRELGVGTVCGKCVPTAREVLNQALATHAVPAQMDALALGMPAQMGAERA